MLLFLGISIGLALALYHVLKSVTAKQKMNISLEKLSFLWKSQDEISLALKEEIIEEIKSELGFGAVKKNNKNRLKLRTKDMIEEGVRSDIKALQEEPDKVIENKKLLNFYLKIEPYLKSDEQNNIIVRLIMFLDKKGSCPSVASSAKDITTAAFKQNFTMMKNVTQYDIFQQITLTDHTLHVCEEAYNALMEKIKERHEQQVFVSPVIIACLAHDIGKVPDLSNTYATGDHPIISARMLMDLGVPQKSDVVDAVLNHHKILAQTNNTIYLMVKAADQAARAKELSDYLNLHSQESKEFLEATGVIEKENQVNASAPVAPDPDIQSNIAPDRPTAPETNTAVKAPEPDIFDDIKPEIKSPAPVSSPVVSAPANNQVQNISLGLDLDNTDNPYGWVDVSKYLSYLKIYINTFDVKDNILKVQSVALSSGIIYFSAFALGNALTNYMKSIGKQPFHYLNDKKQTEDCLGYISKYLFENGALARVNSGFYSNSVNVLFKNNTIIKGFGILINYDVFGFSSISETLANMPDQLKGATDVIIVKDKIKEPQQESLDPFA
jgi:hypothetical protein